MTEAARELLRAFESLPPADQQQVTAEILRRSAGPEGLSETALHGLADELFRSYDAEEAADAGPSAQ
jgi:hypothetical protein